MTSSTNEGVVDGSPIEPLLSSRLIVVANLLRRGAALRYKRLLGLSSVEFGIVAMLGRREPTPVRTLASLVGMDKAQLSRALSALVSRKIVARSANPVDSRDVLVALTREGLRAHNSLIATADAVNRRLEEALSKADAAALHRMLDPLQKTAVTLLEEEGAQE